MHALPAFDCSALFDALNEQRRAAELDWNQLAAVLWQQSSELNARRGDSPLCPGAVPRFGQRGDISCQYAMFVLRWIDRVPEEFLTGPVVDVGTSKLPKAGPDRRLRWSLDELHADLNRRRVEEGLTWVGLGQVIGCTPSRLTNLRTARLAAMDLAMRVTQWLGRPAATYIHPAQW